MFRGLWVAAVLAMPGTALADRFGAWDFDPPRDYERDSGRGFVSYAGAEGTILFLPQAPLAGKSPADALKSAGQEVAAGAQQTEPRMIDAPDGSRLWLLVMQDARAVYALLLHQLDGESGIVVGIAPTQDGLSALIPSMTAARFRPDTDTGPAPSALPEMAFPAPLSGPVAASVTEIDYPAARALGLDPRLDPIPTGFDCYMVESDRHASATPDMLLHFGPGRSWRLDDGRSRASGTWTPEPSEILTRVMLFSGELSPSRHSKPYATGAGQRIEVARQRPEGEDPQKYRCLQQGPAADQARQEMAAVALIPPLLSCIWAEGEQPFTLAMSGGTYATPQGGGRYVAALHYQYSWSLEISFHGGPLDLAQGENRRSGPMEIEQEWTRSSVFTSTTTTVPIASCEVPATPRPKPVYGRGSLPPTGRRTGVEGLFVATDTRDDRGPGQLLWLTADGWMLTDPPLATTGAMPECGRPAPDGDPICTPFDVRDGVIRVQDRTGAWEDEGRATAQQVVIGDTTYAPLGALPPGALTGDWQTSSVWSSNPSIFDTIGSYSSSSEDYGFAADGRFTWGSQSSSRTILAPPTLENPLGNYVLGGSSGYSSDSASGRFALDGHWLLLTPDGRGPERHFVHTLPDDSRERLFIDGVPFQPPH